MPKHKNRIHLKKTIGCVLIVTSTFGLCGCSVFQRDAAQPTHNIVTIDNIDNLVEGGYYVQHGDVYYKLYLGSASFSKGSTSSSANDNRVAWFGEDYDKIPTMYKGDSIVFHTSEPFEESFTIERFEDIGYTIGICNMQKMDSGRYSFSTNPEDLDVNNKSDARQLCEEGDAVAVFDRIGGTDLRSGNISRSGTVVGLTKGKTYSCDIYFGTNIHKYKLTADVRALSSMEVVKLSDYTYTQSKTITFNFPDYFNSGYYYVNGYGIVRYIANDVEFSEDMDMNIPNVYPEDKEQKADDTSSKSSTPDYVTDIREENFSLANDAEVTVTVNYEIPEDTTGLDTPVAKIIGEYNVYTLGKKEDGTLSGTYNLDAGEYTIQIIDLSGRSYTYKVTNALDDKMDTKKGDS